jgi:ribosomal protein S7
MRVVSGLRRQAVGKIEQFTRLRDEGKLLADSGKKSEALEKLEAAFSLMPDRDVAQQIGLLKEDILAATPKMQ